MHIAIDGFPLRSPHVNRGVGVYTKKLIEALRTYKPGHRLTIFDSPKQIPQDADLIHYTWFDPFFLTLPVYSPKPAIVTVHDLIPLLFPDHFPKGIRGRIKWEIQKYSLQRKQGIITDSECSRKDISDIVGMNEGNIDVVYLAPSLHVASETKEFKPVRKAFNIGNHFFLYVGDVNWNKNIPSLLKAFSSFIAGHKNKFDLVLVGKAFHDSQLKEVQEIHTMISHLRIGDQIKMTGFVDDEALTLLYKEAQALIQPSLYEGFGFPVLEAMSLNCPVICSSSSSLPEIAGPSIMVDPKNLHSIEQGMERVISLSVVGRRQLIREGREWASRFTWQKTAEKTMRSYEKVLGEK